MAGLLTVIVILRGNKLLGALSALIGFAIGTVGVDIGGGERRYTFGAVELINGVDFIPVAIGLFAIGEVLHTLWRGGHLEITRLLRGVGTQPRILAEPQGFPGVGRANAAWLVPGFRCRADSRARVRRSRR